MAYFGENCDFTLHNCKIKSSPSNFACVKFLETQKIYFYLTIITRKSWKLQYFSLKKYVLPLILIAQKVKKTMKNIHLPLKTNGQKLWKYTKTTQKSHKNSPRSVWYRFWKNHVFEFLIFVISLAYMPSEPQECMLFSLFFNFYTRTLKSELGCQIWGGVIENLPYGGSGSILGSFWSKLGEKVIWSSNDVSCFNHVSEKEGCAPPPPVNLVINSQLNHQSYGSISILHVCYQIVCSLWCEKSASRSNNATFGNLQIGNVWF